MTNPGNWPNPERPGVPLFSERDGWHWISYCGTPRPLFWSAKSNTWFSSSGTRSRRENTNAHWIYKEPVLTPTQIAELLAGERERCAVICDGIEDEEWKKWKNHADMMAQGASSGAMDCAAAIRNLGAAP